MVSLSPLTGDGESSFDLRFSDRGGKKAVGEVLGVDPPFPDEREEPLFVFSIADEVDVRDVARPPFVEPFRSLE